VRAVSDTSPFIALNSIGRPGLLPELFETITVPAAVADELKSVQVPGWVRVVSIPQVTVPDVREAGLGRGETDAIRLALHLRPDRVLLDDGEGRRETKRLGLRVTGVLGLLATAKRMGFFRRFAPKWTSCGHQDSGSRKVCTRNFSHPVERAERRRKPSRRRSERARIECGGIRAGKAGV
jgi:hypothetical protein